MLYQLTICAAIFACASAVHVLPAASGSDALSGNAFHSHVVPLHKHEHERRAIEAENLHGNEEHIRGSEMEAEASDSLGDFGCVWDGTGAGEEDRMELNCDRLNEDECIAAGNGNKDARCAWKAKDHAKGAHKDTITNAGKEQSLAKKVAADDRMEADLDDDAVQAPLGCLWDGSGCAHDMCDQEQMVARCDDLSHSKASCLGAMGVERRCFWSHGSADDARKAAVAMKIMGLSVDLPETNEEVEVVADAGNRHNENANEVEIAEDEVPQLGCMWDGSGCVDGQCDEEAMNARCAKLSHSKTSCLGSMGQDARCFWSHGAADEEEFKHFEPAEELNVVADAGNRHSAPDGDAEIEENAVPQLGCLWDGSGCVEGQCDEEAMNSRCAKLSHSKTSCLGSMGQDARCFWSHGAADEEEFKHFEPAEELNVIADAGNRHSAPDADAEIAEDEVPQLGCMWDGSGCVEGQCDEEAMNARCAKLSHSKTSCLGSMGRDARCFWSHGAANEDEFEHFKPEELNVVADAGSRHSANSENEKTAEVAEDNVPQLGCLWDGSGCVQGQCDMEAMTARCADLSHSKASCLGDMGKERRCVWSHGADDAKMEDVLNGGFEGALQNMKVSTMEIMLAAAFVMTAACALQRLYRWWADRGYIKLAEEPQEVEPLLMTEV